MFGRRYSRSYLTFLRLEMDRQKYITRQKQRPQNVTDNHEKRYLMTTQIKNEKLIIKRENKFEIRV